LRSGNVTEIPLGLVARLYTLGLLGLLRIGVIGTNLEVVEPRGVALIWSTGLVQIELISALLGVANTALGRSLGNLQISVVATNLEVVEPLRVAPVWGAVLVQIVFVSGFARTTLGRNHSLGLRGCGRSLLVNENIGQVARGGLGR
jgi:hypothetical protein